MTGMTNETEHSQSMDMRIEQIIREADATQRHFSFDEFDDYREEQSWSDFDDEFVVGLTKSLQR